MPQYLTPTLPQYRCGKCEERFLEPEADPYTCPYCGHPNPVFHTLIKAVYAVSREEEGGWFYDAGTLIEHHCIQGFDNYEDAHTYLRALETNYPHDRVMGFTNQMPVPYFPTQRPRYC
mgnify:CR=1 FL=1